MIAMLYDQKPPIFSKNGVYGIRYRQIFSWGYRTKMKIWSDENEKLVGNFFARLWHAKKGVPKL